MKKKHYLIKLKNRKKHQVIGKPSFYNSENQSTLGQAPSESIADTKLIEKSEAGNAPRSAIQEPVSDPIEKITDTENKCLNCNGLGYIITWYGGEYPCGICDTRGHL